MHAARDIRWLAAPVAALVAAMPAAARAGCTWSALAQEGTRAASLRPGTPRVHFVLDDPMVRGCPGEGASCRARTFLFPGDVVLTGPRQGAYACAGFVGTKGAATLGWLPAAALSALPEARQRPADWDGHWVAPERDITIRAGRDGTLDVKGEATWGAADPVRRERGGVHTGEISGSFRPRDGVLAFTMGPDGRSLSYEEGHEFDCRVRIWRRGPYLLVRDNDGCGGMNVTFSGFYRRQD